MSFKEWKKYKLGDLLTTLTDYHANGSYKVLKENVELLEKKEYSIMIRTKNFEQNNFNDFIYVSKHSYDFLKKSKVLPRDIIMNKIANAGSIYLMPDLQYPVSLGMNLFLLRVNENIAFPEFIYYYLKANEAYVKSFAIGSVTTTITKEVVRNLDILLPTKDEQYKIISILKSIEDKIELNRQTNQTLEAIAQTLFKEMCLPKGDDLPEGWRVGKLGDVCKNIRKTAHPKDLKINTVYVGLEHITRKSLCLSEYGIASDVNSQKSIFKEYDILFGKLRPYFHKVCIAPTEGICSTDILVIESMNSEHFTFCINYLYSDELIKYVSLIADGTRMPRVDWKSISDYEIIIPPFEIIKQLNVMCFPFYQNMISNNKESQTLITLRDSLLPKLMKGEIDINISNG